MVAPRRAARRRRGRRLTPRRRGAVRSLAFAALLGAGWLVGPGPAAGAIGGQAADDADAPRLPRVGVAAQLAQPGAAAIEALHDRAVLVGDEDRARARAVG